MLFFLKFLGSQFLYIKNNNNNLIKVPNALKMLLTIREKILNFQSRKFCYLYMAFLRQKTFFFKKKVSASPRTMALQYKGIISCLNKFQKLRNTLTLLVEHVFDEIEEMDSDKDFLDGCFLLDKGNSLEEYTPTGKV